MTGMPAMQEQLQAMARERMAPTPCGFHLWMAGMPAMKEQSQAYGHGWPVCLQCRSNCRRICQHCVLWRFATLCGMAKNIRISDALYDLATVEARLQHRSLAQQVEFWAKLGMAAERLGDGRAVTALDASLEATRRQDVLDVLSGKRRADYTYAIPRSVARRSKAKFRGQEP
jgi:hypothetical protein